MAEGLISLGFMTAQDVHEVAGVIRGVVGRVQKIIDARCRAILLCSEASCNDHDGPSARFDCPCQREIIAIDKRTSIAGERHRLFGAGFIEQAALILVADLDYGYSEESIATTVISGFASTSTVFIPQPHVPEHPEVFTLGEFSRAFEDYVTLRISGTHPKKQHGLPYPRLQTGLYLFSFNAVRELLKRPWIWNGSAWDLEVAYFVLTANGNVSVRPTYVQLSESLPPSAFDPRASKEKLQMINRLSGKLGPDRVKEYFGDFCRDYRHCIETATADDYRFKVLEKL